MHTERVEIGIMQISPTIRDEKLVHARVSASTMQMPLSKLIAQEGIAALTAYRDGFGRISRHDRRTEGYLGLAHPSGTVFMGYGILGL